MINTIESNKLFAEFMGLIESSISNKFWTEKNSEGFGIGQLTELKYDTSWDWLMQVVEKIENNLKYVITINSSPTISSRWLSHKILIQKNNLSDMLDKVFIVKYESDYSKNESKIEATYNACVEFVKWYNQQK
jgi:hypothetical protein